MARGSEPLPSTILVVDDDPAIRRLLGLALERAGFDVIVAGDGAEAFDIIATRAPDLVLCDVGLPGTSGVELVQRLRARSDTATLPVILITGSGDDRSLLEGLDAGADDFLAKPVRLDELVARVRTHLRVHTAWVGVLREELEVRSSVIDALGAMRVTGGADETAEAVVTELAGRTGSDFVSIARVRRDGRMDELATFNRADGVQRGGARFQGELARYLVGRANEGPWVDDVRLIDRIEPSASLRRAEVDLLASAPIVIDGELVAVLSVGSRLESGQGIPAARARLLSAAIDFANALGAMAGPQIAGTRDRDARVEQLERVLAGGEFYPVVQPIVHLETRAIVGHEALTRFTDGTRPDLRFAEAGQVGLGGRLEVAAVSAAIEAARRLPRGPFLSLNVSPSVVTEHGEALRAALAGADRQVVLELTEHVPIDDYAALRAGIRQLGEGLRIAVDDAGAGFASLRHILELGPEFAKVDISLVRGIDGDELRQAAVAGLNYYALRTGCQLIAEGVETGAEREMLQGLGIELAQGYLLGRPDRVP